MSAGKENMRKRNSIIMDFVIGRQVAGMVCALAIGLSTALPFHSTASAESNAAEIALVSVRGFDLLNDALQVEVNDAALAALGSAESPGLVSFPITWNEQVELELEVLNVVAPDARFMSVQPAGTVFLPVPDVQVFRGRVAGQPHSHVFLAFSSVGPANGYLDLSDGRRFFLSSTPGEQGATLSVHRGAGLSGMPGFAELCGQHAAPGAAPVIHGNAVAQTTLSGGPMMARVAIDADQEFVGLFNGNDAAAQAYIVQVIAAVSDIYIRDLDIRLVLSFVRTWPNGGAPFEAADLPGFATHWQTNENMTGLNYVHLFSGERDTFFGGNAYLTHPCSGSAFAVSAWMLGSFPTPVGAPHLANWDVEVVAHEMGHNSGSGHTHDTYEPPIDMCGFGVWSRGDIMSYCNTTAGGMLNVDMRFHARVQQVVASAVQACLPFDCNQNNIEDAQDITQGGMPDMNSNGIPDQCEDCNHNGILDSVDIAQGAVDVDVNGIPDVCEPDCNLNSQPDLPEIAKGNVTDTNGNLVPDECDPDCDGNGISDHAEIAEGLRLDVDRNSIPDNCDDCNANGIEDYIDLERESNVFLCQWADNVREYHQASGVGVRTLGTGPLFDPYDLVFGPDRQLYVASFGNDRIVRINVDNGTTSDFVPAGSGGLDGPSSLIFGPNGNLFVSSNLSNSVLEYHGTTGALVGTLVSSGSGGLIRPHGLAFLASGDLLVAGNDATVRRYHGATGAYVGLFVTAGSGGLSGPRGIALAPDGRLLVSSTNTNSVLLYDATGAFVRVFSTGPIPNGAWGIRFGPGGHVFVVRHSGEIRVIEYDYPEGRYLQSYIRGDSLLTSPTGIAFRPASALDCNQNFALDTCDLSSGESLDCQSNSVPDECDIAAGTSTDVNGDGRPDECDCPPIPPLLAENSGPCLNDGECQNESTCIAGRCYVPKNRYISFESPLVAPGESALVRVKHVASGRSWWVAEHNPADPADVYRLSNSPTCVVWDGAPLLIHVSQCGVSPAGQYVVQATHCGCAGAEGNFSPAVTIPTIPKPGPKFWGDSVGVISGATWTPPNGFVNVQDVTAAIKFLQGDPVAPHRSWVDLHPEATNALVNVADVQQFVLAIQGAAYPYALPSACP